MTTPAAITGVKTQWPTTPSTAQSAVWDFEIISGGSAKCRVIACGAIARSPARTWISTVTTRVALLLPAGVDECQARGNGATRCGCREGEFLSRYVVVKSTVGWAGRVGV